MCAYVSLCLLSSGILLLNRAVGRDEVEGFGLGLEDGIGVTTQDDQDIIVLQRGVGLLEGNLGADKDTRVRKDLRLSTSNGDVEGLGSYKERAN